jgi:WD40 repeat protein
MLYTLDIRAEMWSLAFNPNDPTQIATCSEDQRVHVYKDALTSPTLVVNLEGHGLAVTSLDW